MADTFDPAVEYRDIPGFDGFYKVGSDGSVWSNKTRANLNKRHRLWKCMKLHINGHGYPFVILTHNFKQTRVIVSRLVLTLFAGPPEPGMQACHFPDPDVRNNRLNNLRWGTAKDNADDRQIHSHTAIGERHGMSKLTADEVVEIRRRCASGENHKSIAGTFGISPSTVAGIKGRRWWNHV